MLVIQSHWGLQQMPFRDNPERPAYFPAETHEEALARLQYVVDQCRPACIIEGEPGAGKTFISRLQAQLARERGLGAIWMNLRGANETELRDSLAERLAITSAVTWPHIGQAIQELALSRRRLLIVGDDADLATPEAIEQLRGLLERYGADVTMSLTSRSASIGRLHHRFGGLSELRVVLESWSIDDTVDFIIRSLEAVGGDPYMLEPDAYQRVHQLAQGRPREIGRLVRLSLLAAAGYRLDAIDAETVDTVASELVA